ncbi:MAG: DUF7146 domain-containing protein [Pseudomonadota bacterium]
MTDARTLTERLGGNWRGRYGLAPCPVCQPERRRDQRALSLAEEGGRLLAHCFKSGCSFHAILSAAGSPDVSAIGNDWRRADLEAKRDAQAEATRAAARRLWKQALPIHGTPAEDYLRGRGITAELPPSLRFAPRLRHAPSGAVAWAMVADVQPTGGVHRTFPTPKKGVRKMMLGPCAGGAVRLSEGAGPLVVCEGIETGLSLLSGLLRGSPRVWAALSTSGMKSLELPTEPGRLTVASDGDAPGREAAHCLASRAHALGWEVSLLPAPNGCDWNDVLAKGVSA